MKTHNNCPHYPVSYNPFKPGDLITKVRGTRKYFVLNTSGGWVATDLENNWKHHSQFVLHTDGSSFREDLRERLENFINEHNKEETPKETGKDEGEDAGTTVAHEAAVVAPQA